MKVKFDKLAYKTPDELIYGICPKPLKTKSGMVIGGGEIYPELNFTLPGMNVNEKTINTAYKIYRDMISGALKRAAELYAPGVVVEYEALPDFTANPKWGLEVTRILLEVMKEMSDKYGLKSALRATPNDMREMSRPPIMRSGRYWEGMLEFFEGCGELGADFISIESTGGKELNDDALVNADIKGVILAMGVLGCRDMEFLWGKIVEITDKHKIYAAGDSACGFANTAMVLAEKGFIPRSFAAVVRVIAASRSLVAYEMGAVAPSKDCAYEGPFLKTIAGIPIAMEGKSAAGAHLSPLGNIAAYAADLWSNESIQQVKLLSDMAPTVGMEQLIYDCRLMNQAAKAGKRLDMRNWLIESDAALDVQAYILRPEVVFRISSELVKAPNAFLRTKLAGALAVQEIKKAVAENKVIVDKRDAKWLNMMEAQIESIPDDPLKFYTEMKPELNMSKFIPKEYELD